MLSLGGLKGLKAATRKSADSCQAMDDNFVAQALGASNRVTCIDRRSRKLEVAAASSPSRTEKVVSWTHCNMYSMDALMDQQSGGQHHNKLMGYDGPDISCSPDQFCGEGGNMMETSKVDEVNNEALIPPHGGEATSSLDANTSMQGAQSAGRYTGSSDNPFTRAFH